MVCKTHIGYLFNDKKESPQKVLQSAIHMYLVNYKKQSQQLNQYHNKIRWNKEFAMMIGLLDRFQHEL